MQPSVEVVPVGGPPALPADKGRKESPLERKGFEYYFSLGEGRTLNAVAAHFGNPLTTVRTWSSRHGWPSRIKELQSKTLQEQTVEKSDRFLHNQIELLLMHQAEMVIPDPANPQKMVLTDKATIYSLKETTNSCLSILKAISEKVGIKIQEKDLEAGPGGGRAGKGQGGVMVNVIFKGINQNEQGLGMS